MIVYFSGIINDRKVKVVSTSIIRFIAQFLFGCWIGFLFSLVTVLLVGTGHRVLLALFIAAGVTQGCSFVLCGATYFSLIIFYATL